MKYVSLIVWLIAATATSVGAIDVMETSLNVYREGDLISDKLGTVEESVTFGDSAAAVIEKIKAKPKALKEKGRLWTISFERYSTRPPSIKWRAEKKRTLAVGVELFGTEEDGLAEIQYEVFIAEQNWAGVWTTENASNVVRLYKWMESLIGEPVESPANLINLTTISAAWVLENDIVVHLFWEESSNYAKIRIVTPAGPSKAEVEMWVKAHTAQFTMEEFMKIRVGMSLDEVLETIGSYGELQSEEFVDGQVIQTYGWTNGDGSKASIAVNQDRIVVKKIQDGLR